MQAEKAACFKRGHCARAGQNDALRLQPGVGGEKHSRLFLFSPLRACRTEKGVLVPAGSGGKETQPLILIFRNCARAGQKMRFGFGREQSRNGFREMRLVFSAVFQHKTTGRSQNMKPLRHSAVFQCKTAERSQNKKAPLINFRPRPHPLFLFPPRAPTPTS